ncbi:hypothetical protein BDZ45DRAFT_797633 [Acephala macrosclerotiorum]|nr:hypothetical protein BDZ45DRAFT_797633 [Acephala macrosclerotiorum]
MLQVAHAILVWSSDGLVARSYLSDTQSRDGDGKCGFLIVDEKTNSVHTMRSDYSRETDTFAWTDMGIVSGDASCTETYGTGLYDLAVRFADIDGDGKADYLRIDQVAAVTGFLNNGLNSIMLVGEINFT